MIDSNYTSLVEKVYFVAQGPNTTQSAVLTGVVAVCADLITAFSTDSKLHY